MSTMYSFQYKTMRDNENDDTTNIIAIMYYKDIKSSALSRFSTLKSIKMKLQMYLKILTTMTLIFWWFIEYKIHKGQ